MKNHINIRFSKFVRWYCYVLGLIAFSLCAIAYDWRAGVVFAVVYAVIGTIRVDGKDTFVRFLWCMAMLFLVCFASQVMVGGGNFFNLPVKNIALEFLIAMILWLTWFILSGRKCLSAMISVALLMIFTFVCYLVVLYRGTDLTPMDFFAVHTAFSVAGRYHFEVRDTLFYSICIILGGYLSYGCLPVLKKNADKKQRKMRLFLFPVLICCILLWYAGCDSVEIITFGRAGAGENGFLVNFSKLFISTLKDMRLEGYSLGEVRRIEDGYNDSEKPDSVGEYPDIIILMDESFSDLSILGSEIRTEKEVTPFLDGLEKNTVKGYALASVYGGQTANSEYECLTGNTTSFLTEGTVVYQNYLEQESYSIVSVLKKLGYSTFATHPNEGSLWARSTVYHLLGFDEMAFIEDYPGKDLCRGLVSDMEMVRFLEDEYDKRAADAPLFMFGVTIQNHGGYSDGGEDVPESIALEGYRGSYPDAEQYLGLLHKTDQAMEEMVRFFEKQERKVVFLMFGDHQPNLDKGFLEEVHGGNFKTLDEQELKYMVPYFLWCNFDSPLQETEKTVGVYDLSSLVYEAAGLPLPAYNRFLNEMQDEVDALNHLGILSERNGWIGFDETDGAEDEWIEDYRILIYNSLFDTEENRSGVFFP